MLPDDVIRAMLDYSVINRTNPMQQRNPASREQRRRRILEAARSVFEEDGTLDGGLRRIAASAGYTTGAIYKMFSGKDDIYAALLEESLREFGHAAAMAAATRADPEAALRASAKVMVEYYQAHQFEYRLGLYMFERDGAKGLGAERDAKLNALLESALAVFQTCFQKIGGGHLSADRSRELTHALFAALAGVLALLFSARDKSLKTSWQKILDTTLVCFVNEAKR